MISPSGGDDSAVIQAALDAKGYAELDAGDFTASLNLTNRQGIVLKGQGTLNTRIHATVGCNAVIDLTGSTNAQLRDFRVMASLAALPTVGILSAQTPSPTSDVTVLEGVRVEGFFRLAAWYCFSVQSSRVIGGQFYNSQPHGMAAILTSANNWNVTSQFAQVRQTNDMRVSDWEIISTEFHSLSAGWAVWLGAVSAVKFRGGNASSSAPIMSNNAVMVSGVTAYPDHVIVDGMTFYSDFAPIAPYAVGGLTTPPYITFRDVISEVGALTGP